MAVPRSRDFIDLYSILQKGPAWSIDGLVRKAQIKFNTFVDPLQLGAQFLRATELKDYPRMIIPLDTKSWQDFFVTEAERIARGEIDNT